MEFKRGKLVLSKKGKPQIQYISKKGKTVTANPAEGELSRTILDNLQAMNGQDVEFELIGGQPKKIRGVGEEFVPPSPSRDRTSRSGRHKSSSAGQRHGSTQQSYEKSRDFHNPYNFIPAPPRKTNHQELGDHKPPRQDQFLPNRLTGRIRVRMKAITPLLLPDPERCTERPNGHKIFDILLGADGKPLIPASSVRGMLRSAYEAVTNSRFGRFDSAHKNRLAFRMEVSEGLKLIPARVADGKIRLLTGTSKINSDGSPNGPQYAAWLPRYSGANKATDQAVRYPDGSLPQHGDKVECWVERIQHYRWDKNGKQHKKDFQYWRVRAICKKGENLSKKPGPSQALQKQDRKSWHEPLGEIRQIEGWVCITNPNINRKHDERVFFIDAPNAPPGPFKVTEEHRKKWKELIENYQEIHEKDLEDRKKENHKPDEYLGREPGRTAWSRHVYTKEDLELRDGMLCYVRLNKDHTEVEALFPVMISRELYEASPWELLHESLRPAESIDQLSPADRVFGWVRADAEMGSCLQDDRVAAKGLLRIGPVNCETDAADAIERFNGEGLPLAILAEPKPQQGRFYVAASPYGEAQEDGLTKQEAGYRPGKGLRGRKVYPHHLGLPENYWQKPMEDRTQEGNGPWQEYRRPRKNDNEQRDSQNRSTKAWVKPGTEFTFDINFLNLSKVELGALLLLLNLPENHYHRFGGGKPLGFGSVRLTIDSCEINDQNSLKEKYSSWNPKVSTADGTVIKEAVQAFKSAVSEAYNEGKEFENTTFIKAFLRSCRGFSDGKPVYYPRATEDGRPGPPNPVGESFKWFVANEKKDNQYALHNLWDDEGLPTLQDPQADRR